MVWSSSRSATPRLLVRRVWPWRMVQDGLLHECPGHFGARNLPIGHREGADEIMECLHARAAWTRLRAGTASSALPNEMAHWSTPAFGCGMGTSGGRAVLTPWPDRR